MKSLDTEIYSSQSRRNSEQTEAVLSVSSLNKMAKSILEGNFPAVFVEGEISNLATPASGHWYLTLKDSRSQLRCAMFVNRNRFVRFKPQNGNQILVRGKLSIYEGRGDYQLIIDSMEEAGDGALRRAFEELKTKLHKEGLFDEDKKQEVFNYYEHIGVVTSATGAAIQDILSVFERRFPATRITLLPVAVQGDEAPQEIARAIGLANQLANKLGIQALIVGRGGGSLEDLQAFNSELVARAIFSSELPVTSAVGHEIDFTIADFVADLRAPTPSAAAEQMSPDQDEYYTSFNSYRAELTRRLKAIIRQSQQHLTWLGKQLKRPDRRLQEHAQNLDRLEQQLSTSVRNKLILRAGRLERLQQAIISHSPKSIMKLHGVQLKQLHRDLAQNMGNHISQIQSQIAQLSRSLSAVSPLNTLARGYSITFDADNKIVHTATRVTVGSKLQTRLSDGTITSIVESSEIGKPPALKKP